MKDLFLLARPKHWIKNLFILIPAFFAQVFLDSELLLKLFFGFLSFSIVTSSVYTLNDLKDKDFDRQHPEKKDRPIASGRVKSSVAIIFSICLALAGFGIAFSLNTAFGFITLGYLVMNIIYSMGLKNQPLIDVFIIAVGFELRVYSGGVLAEVPISPWLSLMIFLLALFLAFAKRRSDLVLSENSGVTRKSVTAYNLDFLNTVLGILASVLILAYIMYTQTTSLVPEKAEYQILTSVFVIFGILRYLQQSLVQGKGGQPVLMLLRDRFVLFCLLGWLALNYWILY